MVLLRDAAPQDVLAIAQFQTTCWREVYVGLVPQEYLDRVGVAERELLWRERLVSGARRIVLAEIEQNGAVSAVGVVGVVSWSTAAGAEGPALELKSLYLAPDQRGTGLASRLLIRAVGTTAAASLWVFEQNLRAQAFYRKHGFTPDGLRTTDTGTGVPELRMSRPDQFPDRGERLPE